MSYMTMARAAGAIALAMILAGCASTVPVRDKGAPGGVQGGAWELVLPGPPVAAALAAAEPQPAHPWYLTRRDESLGATTPSWAPVATAGADLPPTIERQRSIFLHRSPRSFLFFTSPQPWAAPPPPPRHRRHHPPLPPPALWYP